MNSVGAMSFRPGRHKTKFAPFRASKSAGTIESFLLTICSQFHRSIRLMPLRAYLINAPHTIFWAVTLFRSGIEGSCQESDPGPRMIGETDPPRFCGV